MREIISIVYQTNNKLDLFCSNQEKNSLKTLILSIKGLIFT